MKKKLDDRIYEEKINDVELFLNLWGVTIFPNFGRNCVTILRFRKSHCVYSSLS